MVSKKVTWHGQYKNTRACPWPYEAREALLDTVLAAIPNHMFRANVELFREYVLSDVTKRDLARRYGVSPSVIQTRIWRGRYVFDRTARKLMAEQLARLLAPRRDVVM